MERRLDKAEVRHGNLERYTRKFNLVIHGISEREDENNVENVMELGKLLDDNLTHGDIDIVSLDERKIHEEPTPNHHRPLCNCKLQRRVCYTKPDYILEIFFRKI